MCNIILCCTSVPCTEDGPKGEGGERGGRREDTGERAQDCVVSHYASTLHREMGQRVNLQWSS